MSTEVPEPSTGDKALAKPPCSFPYFSRNKREKREEKETEEILPKLEQDAAQKKG